MKRGKSWGGQTLDQDFSALGRAVWDETSAATFALGHALIFQCSRSSRMG